MSLFQFFLAMHIIAGTIGLVIGPIVMYAPKRKGLHTQAGTAYFFSMTTVCASALILAGLHWKKSWWFALVAAFSFQFALRGYLAARNRGQNWLPRHISGMLGSYIAMTTALLVVNASAIPGSIPDFVYWLLPTIIGTPLIVLTVRRYRR